MKVGDLVKGAPAIHSPAKWASTYCTGIIIEVVDGHWDAELPGYVPGDFTYKVQWLRGAATFHDESELELINEAE